MKVYKYPQKESLERLCQRPTIENKNLDTIIKEVFTEVRLNKDNAVLKYTKTFDDVKISQTAVSIEETDNAADLIPDDLKSAIKQAKQNIEKFHASQFDEKKIIETSEGVFCWQENRAIEKVGLYIPGGSAPLFSSVLMLGIPAKIAACKEIILCSPPNKMGNIHPAILHTAKLVGIQKIYKIGGAQAIAAMTFGTESVPQVFKIFGPGNQFVTRAKELAQLEGVAIDMPAGPSEVLIIADATANPKFIAADLLSQAEHGEDSQVILLSDNKEIIEKTMSELEQQLEQIPRKSIAQKALQSSKAIIFKTLQECISFSNLYAPEHLIIASEKASQLTHFIINAGSVFLGNYSCESAGDYASGTNHTLPTNGFAKKYSGVTLDSFMKKISFQKITKEGLQNLGPAIEKMALTEELEAHKNAVSIRLKSIENV